MPTNVKKKEISDINIIGFITFYRSFDSDFLPNFIYELPAGQVNNRVLYQGESLSRGVL